MDIFEFGLLLGLFCQPLRKLTLRCFGLIRQTHLATGKIIPIAVQTFDFIMKLRGPANDIDNAGFFILQLGL